MAMYAAKMDDTYELFSGVKIEAMAIPEANWDIEGLMDQDGPTLIYGDSESMKSWLSMYICRALATGKPLFGKLKTRKYDEVIYINLDSPKWPTFRRVRALGRLDGGALENMYLTHWTPIMWSLARFNGLLKAHPKAFVVIDCLSAIFNPDPVKHEQNAEMRQYLQEIRDIYEEHKCSGIIIDHAKKGSDDYYGGVQKKATLRMMWLVSRPPTGNNIFITCKKASEFDKFTPVTLKYRKAEGAPIITLEAITEEIPESSLRQQVHSLVTTEPRTRIAALRDAFPGVPDTTLKSYATEARKMLLAASPDPA